jgi:hypothetical protein
MSSEDDDAPDWGGAITSALEEAGEEDDEEGINVVSNDGLSATAAAASETGTKELPYVILLKAAVSTLQSGEITEAQYIEGIKKLDTIADQALKVYEIPAVKKDLPGKLTDYQNQIVAALEEQIHRLKEGLALMLSYPTTKAIGDMETGLQIAVDALNASANIQKKADTEREAIRQQEKEDKAKRAQKAAESDS